MGVSNGSSQPGPFKPGMRSLDTDTLNRMWNTGKGNRPGIHQGAGVLVRTTSGGSLFEVEGRRRGSSTTHPFKISIANKKIRVKYGTLNSMEPTWNTVPLSNDPPPESTAVTLNTLVILKITWSGSIVQKAEIITDTMMPENGDELSHVLIGQVNVQFQISQAVKTSLWTERLKCGNNDPEFFVYEA
jgi:hypothetical protein